MKKVCKKCLESKDFEAFSNYSASKDGKRNWCRECMNAQNRAYMKTPKGKEVHNGTNKRYYKTDKGKESRNRDRIKNANHRKIYNNSEHGKKVRKKWKNSKNGKLSRKNDYKRTRELFSEKYKARYLLANAVRKGAIIKSLSCERCNKQKNLQGHHHDYNKPYDVEWLCFECHKNHHIKEGTWKRIVK